ncbi:MAG: hypothetical protein CAK88_08645 [Verrucomicrobiia bacterium AMD-G2]|nr:MAG: hypothetical protein CAK88_08645 [Verrucomicrobiae bacterium AMD-G2]
MDLNLLKVVHLAGAFGVFMALGAIYFGAQESCRKCASMLHGISLLLLFLVGFASLGKPPMELHYWKIKIVLWLFLGVAPVLARKKYNADFGIVGSHVGSRRIGGLFGRDEAILNIVRKNPQEMVCKV